MYFRTGELTMTKQTPHMKVPERQGQERQLLNVNDWFYCWFFPLYYFWTHERDGCTFKEDNCQCSLLKRGLLKRKEFAPLESGHLQSLYNPMFPILATKLNAYFKGFVFVHKTFQKFSYFSQKKVFADISCKLSFQGNGFRHIRQTVSLGKQVLTFHANCLLRQFAWNVKVCFLGKIRKYRQYVICWFSPESGWLVWSLKVQSAPLRSCPLSIYTLPGQA